MSAPNRSEALPPFRLASEMTRRPVHWLWPGRLALGTVAVLEGDPGLGKSFLALDLCARLSAGRPWPGGAPAPEPASCVYLNGEDGTEDTVGPRLQALGADLGRVFRG
jgi:RecA-family ATPase